MHDRGAAQQSTRQAVSDALSEFYPAYLTRYAILRDTFAPLAHLFRGKHVLDYGCGRGLSSIVLVELGASHVTGVELFPQLVTEGRALMAKTGYSDRVELQHVEDTTNLPFFGGRFSAVVCNAVFEHVPQPRKAWIAETWRMVQRGGVLIVNETPNKYLPVDYHTLHLPLTNWLPSRLAHWIGVKTGRFRAARDDWAYSGWRGLGYYELVDCLTHPHAVEWTGAKLRHQVLGAVGLPRELLDPYPSYVVRKG